MPKLKHFDNTGTARFITFNCYRNEPSLTDDTAKIILTRFIDKTRLKHEFCLLGYVIMPEHVHLVIYPKDGTPIGRVIGEIKSLTARDWFGQEEITNSNRTNVFWQKRCYDHNCRTPGIVREKIGYCHSNPVRSGLVAQQKDWIWSSYNWYMGKRDVSLRMDVSEF